MTTAVIRGPRQVDFLDLPTHDPGLREVVILVDACGVCGFDRDLFAGTTPWYPVAPGHEITGVVSQVGAGVDRRWVGQRVIADLMRRCGECDACQAGRSAVCMAPPHTLPGGIVDLGRGFSDRLVLRSSRVRAVPGVSRDEAVLAEPLACVVHAVRVSGHGAGLPAAVIGGGVMAALFALVLQRMGAQVTVVSPHADCRRRCGSLGARTCSNVPSGQATLFLLSPRSTEAALSRLQPGGRLVVYTGGHGTAELPGLDVIHRTGCALIGSYSHEPADWDTAADLLRDGLLRPAVELLVGHRIPLRLLADAVGTVREPGKRTLVILGQSYMAPP